MWRQDLSTYHEEVPRSHGLANKVRNSHDFFRRFHKPTFCVLKNKAIERVQKVVLSTEALLDTILLWMYKCAHNFL